MVKIFISWSGERSRSAAEGLRDWLRSWSRELQPWMSQRDIQAGKRWNEVLARNLESADFGIMCLTPENIEKPWLLFEAGAVSNSVGKRTGVIPYLLFDLGVERLPQPFSQFQSVRADFAGTLRLVRALTSKPDSGPLLKQSFSACWPRLEAHLNRARAISGQPWRSSFILESPPEYNQNLETSDDVLLVGVSLESTLKTYKDLLKTKRDLRVLIASPERGAIEAAVSRKSTGTALLSGIASKVASIEYSLAVFREIHEAVELEAQTGVRRRAQLRTTRYPLAYGAHVMNARAPAGVGYIKFYPYRVQNAQKPWLVIRANRDREYGWFLDELEALWADGRVIDYDARPNPAMKRTGSARRLSR